MHQKKRFVSLPTQGKEGHLQYSYYCNTVSLTHTYTHTERASGLLSFQAAPPIAGDASLTTWDVTQHWKW